MAGFGLEQSEFTFHAPAIAGWSAVVLDNPVTGNCDRDLVGCTRSRDGANGFRCANPPGYFGVAGSLTYGNFGQRPPNTLLKDRAAHIEREVEANLGVFDKADNMGDDCFEVTISAE